MQLCSACNRRTTNALDDDDDDDGDDDDDDGDDDEDVDDDDDDEDELVQFGQAHRQLLDTVWCIVYEFESSCVPTCPVCLFCSVRSQMRHVEPSLRSAEPLVRRAAHMSVAVSSEGCSDHIRSKSVPVSQSVIWSKIGIDPPSEHAEVQLAAWLCG